MKVSCDGQSFGIDPDDIVLTDIEGAKESAKVLRRWFVQREFDKYEAVMPEILRLLTEIDQLIQCYSNGPWDDWFTRRDAVISKLYEEAE